jgi:bile acid-coenzyme A ligase
MSQAPPHAEGLHGFGWLLSHQAVRDPNRPAYTIDGQTWTRGELDSRANRMARALEQLGVGQDDLIGIMAPNGLAHHVFAFAIWKLGATPLPLSAKLPDAELKAIVDLAQPKLVIGATSERLPGVRVLPVDFEPDPGLSDAPHPEKIAKVWKVITSGGSTGRPKLIVDAGPAAADAQTPVLQMELEDVMLHPAPLYHTAGFAQTNWGLVWGSHVIEMSRFDPREWLRLVQEHKVRWAYLVPTMMNRIMTLPAEERLAFDVSSIRIAIHMAAPCPPWLKQAFIDWLGAEKIWEVYAGTEGIGGARLRGDEWLAHPGTVGKPIAECRILDEDGKELPIGEVGEIFFKMPDGPTYSYIGAERRAREGGWESLGDLGRLDAEGYLYLADRRTDMIVSGGANIYPAEIEAVLDRHPAVATSAVVGLPHADFGRAPHAILELRPGASPPDPEELNAFLGERLTRYKLPHTFEVSPTPLRDDAGKMRRTALRDAREARLAAGESFISLKSRQPKPA